MPYINNAFVARDPHSGNLYCNAIGTCEREVGLHLEMIDLPADVRLRLEIVQCEIVVKMQSEEH